MFIGRPYVLFTEPPLFTPWWRNFVLYWSFALELGICAWPLIIYRRRRLALSWRK